jgi:hypothetical protein
MFERWEHDMNLRNAGPNLLLVILLAIVVVGGFATWRETRPAAYVDIPPAPVATSQAVTPTASPAAATGPAKRPAPATSEVEDGGSDAG